MNFDRVSYRKKSRELFTEQYADCKATVNSVLMAKRLPVFTHGSLDEAIEDFINTIRAVWYAALAAELGQPLDHTARHQRLIVTSFDYVAPENPDDRRLKVNATVGTTEQSRTWLLTDCGQLEQAWAAVAQALGDEWQAHDSRVVTARQTQIALPLDGSLTAAGDPDAAQTEEAEAHANMQLNTAEAGLGMPLRGGSL